MDFLNKISTAAGKTIKTCNLLKDGTLSKVHLVKFSDGKKVIAKSSFNAKAVLNEAFSLNYLEKYSKLRVPNVFYCDENLMLMEFIGSNQIFTNSHQIEAADQIACLHKKTSDTFGFDRSTYIGGLLQPNTPSGDWIEFFRDHRLKFMASQACKEGKLPTKLHHQIDNLCKNLGDLISTSDTPRLIHGDLWSGNILIKEKCLSGFIDPAIYFANKEVELAFILLFSTFDDTFFARYREHHPIETGFFEERKDIYNLYPLLIHARLFGGHYVTQITHILKRFG